MSEFKLGDTVRMKPGQQKMCPSGEPGPFRLDACDIQDIKTGFIRKTLKARYEVVEKPVNKAIDFTRPVTTRDGRKVRILCTDVKGRGHIVYGLVEDGDTENIVSWYKETGAWSHDGESRNDLINPPVKKYINLFPDGAAKVYYDTREEAEKSGNASKNAGYIKTIEVEL